MKISKPFLTALVSLIIIGVGSFVYLLSHHSNTQQKYFGKSEISKVDTDMKVPATKMPPISANVGPLLQSLLERVWVTKYFGAASEIFHISSDMPLCNALPNLDVATHNENDVFLWKYGCVPVQVLWKANDKNLSGTAVVRMLDFGGSADVLDETFDIIRGNSLGIYRIREDKKAAIKTLINEELEEKSIKPPLRYKHFLKTYPTLEGRFFLDTALVGNSDVTNEPEDMRKYFSHRGKKHALSIIYNSKEYKKEGNIVEYSLILPTGFFGLEDVRKK